jgi:hypothetical protein
MHIGQTVIAAGVAEGQLFVVETHLMQYCSVQVVDVNLVADRVPAEFVPPFVVQGRHTWCRRIPVRPAAPKGRRSSPAQPPMCPGRLLTGDPEDQA